MGMECIGRVITQHGYGVYFQGTHPTWVWSVLAGYSPNMGMEFIGKVLTQHGYGVYW